MRLVRNTHLHLTTFLPGGRATVSQVPAWRNDSISRTIASFQRGQSGRDCASRGVFGPSLTSSTRLLPRSPPPVLQCRPPRPPFGLSLAGNQIMSASISASEAESSAQCACHPGMLCVVPSAVPSPLASHLTLLRRFAGARRLARWLGDLARLGLPGRAGRRRRGPAPGRWWCPSALADDVDA